MMRKILYALTLTVGCLTASGQNDPSKQILAKLSNRIDSYKSLYIEYTIRTENKQAKTENLVDGKILSKKNKFVLKTKDAEIYCDGTTQWMYLKEDNEVTVSKADNDSDDILSNPVKFLTGKAGDFKYAYKDNVEEDGKTFSEINYYPKNLKTPYSYIRMHFNEKDLIPYSIKYVGKDGINHTVRLKTYKPDVEIPDDGEFVFDPAEFPGIEIVDLRN